MSRRQSIVYQANAEDIAIVRIVIRLLRSLDDKLQISQTVKFQSREMIATDKCDREIDDRAAYRVDHWDQTSFCLQINGVD